MYTRTTFLTLFSVWILKINKVHIYMFMYAQSDMYMYNIMH